MAGNVNKVFLMGNLTRDVQLKHTANNTAIANFGIAVNRRYRNSNGENQEETTFVDCEAWARTAETMAKYLTKGRPVFVEGRLRLNEWQDRDGNKRSKLLVVVDTFTFVDSRQGGGSQGSSQGGSQDGSHQQEPANTGGYGSGPSNDDIPF
ncbi:MAG: single-stranded DNA-binding protein [Phycisphaerae bacterium]|mgnify:FL=1|jgi:single-strand DNA-binding protein|nr:single-stranded DNA-binding protein [Phycisphaerae bacterium]MBT7351663.1 single-stranded DNA-binding protein [Phycisphaerae bacterium]